MKKYSVRPATTRDLEAVYALIAAQNTSDYGEAMLTLDDLERSWQNVHLETSTCMAYADNRLAGYAELRDGDWPFIYLTDPHNVDLGFQLLTILEEIAIDRRTKELTTRVSEKNQTLLELFTLNGYHTDLTFLMMELVMSEPPLLPQWREDICVRSFVAGQDEQATYRADEESAEDKGYHLPLDYEAWSRRMGMDRERFDPSLWFLACDGEEIAGVALNAFDAVTDTAWVDHLGVRRHWRRQGIGKALLQHALGEFYRRDIRRAKLSVDSKSLTNAPRLYESVGMKPIQKYRIYRKNLQV